MNVLAFLLNSAPSAAVFGAIVAISFLLVFIGIAFIAFKALKKTVRMAFRLAVVGVILAIAVAGSLSLWYFSGFGSPKLKPPVERRR